MCSWSSFVADNKSFCRTILLQECLQRSQIRIINAARAFYLYSHFPPAQNIIHFQSCFRSPKIDFIVEPSARAVAKQFHQNEMFDCLSEMLSFFLRNLAMDKGRRNTDIKPRLFLYWPRCNSLPGRSSPFQRPGKSPRLLEKSSTPFSTEERQLAGWEAQSWMSQG